MNFLKEGGIKMWNRNRLAATEFLQVRILNYIFKFLEQHNASMITLQGQEHCMSAKQLLQYLSTVDWITRFSNSRMELSFLSPSTAAVPGEQGTLRGVCSGKGELVEIPSLVGSNPKCRSVPFQFKNRAFFFFRDGKLQILLYPNLEPKRAASLHHKYNNSQKHQFICSSPLKVSRIIMTMKGIFAIEKR